MDKSKAVDWVEKSQGLEIQIRHKHVTLIFEKEEKTFSGKNLVEAVERAIEGGF